MKTWQFAAAIILSGCAAHSAVPVQESSGLAPETLREVLASKVHVAEHAVGGNAGGVFVDQRDPDGTWRGCGFSPKGNVLWRSTGRWKIGSDSRGRATFSFTVDGKSYPRRIYVVRYDPATGEIEFRRREGGSGWTTSSRGWLQARWPQVAVEKCKGLSRRGLGVDSRQTGTNLAALRRQAPDAPLKNLTVPLPPPAGKQSAAPASVVPSGSGVAGSGGAIGAQLSALTDEDRSGLVAMGVPERMLPAFEDQAISPALWAKLLEKGFTVEDIAVEASAPVEKRAQDYELRVVSVRDGVATLRTLEQDWHVREGERVYTIGRVARITTDGDVWLQGMSEPLPRAAR